MATRDAAAAGPWMEASYLCCWLCVSVATVLVTAGVGGCGKRRRIVHNNVGGGGGGAVGAGEGSRSTSLAAPPLVPPAFDSRRESTLTRSMQSDSGGDAPAARPTPKPKKPTPKPASPVRPSSPRVPVPESRPSPQPQTAPLTEPSVHTNTTLTTVEPSPRPHKHAAGTLITSNVKPGVIMDGDIAMIEVKKAKPGLGNNAVAPKNGAPDTAVLPSVTESSLEVAHEAAPQRDPQKLRDRARQMMEHLRTRNDRCDRGNKGGTEVEKLTMMTDEIVENPEPVGECKLPEPSAMSARSDSFPTVDTPDIPPAGMRLPSVKREAKSEDKELPPARRHIHIYSPVYVPPEKRQFRPVSEIPADDLTVKREVAPKKTKKTVNVDKNK